jgi:hypothetical protein
MSNKITAEHKTALSKAIGAASKTLAAADAAASDNSDPVAKRLFASEQTRSAAPSLAPKMAACAGNRLASTACMRQQQKRSES